MYDFIIIGAGLAGVSFAHTLEKNGKTFCLLSDHSQVASLIAGGVYNPVVLKRFTPVWHSEDIMNSANRFYDEIEAKMQCQFRIPIHVVRKFASVEEQNNWFTASDNPLLAPYLSPVILPALNEALPAPFGLGEVLHTGRLNVQHYITESIKRWQAEGVCYEKTFVYDDLEVYDAHVVYCGVSAQNIIFCEGCGIAKNPYFSKLPMRPCKGETLTISAPRLQLQHIYKSDGVLIPLGDDKYILGATYDPEDLTEVITEAARTELLEKLRKMTNVPYEVLSHQAAIRPTVADRRPLLGQHPQHSHLWVFNGLGTRGVLNAPYCAEVLYAAAFEEIEIPHGMNINRFAKRFRH